MKAIVANGAILPKEPLPMEWADGTELEVAMAPAGASPTHAELDRCMATDRRPLTKWIQRTRSSSNMQFARLANKRALLSPLDIALAAFAMQMNATLLTTDLDFEAVSEIRTENWRT